LTGSVAAALNLISRYYLNRFMSFDLAVIIAYLIAMIVAFALAKAFVFKEGQRTASEEFVRFSIVNAGALFMVWFVSVSLARHIFPTIGFTFHAHDVAHLIGVVASSVPTFFAHKSYTFAE